MGKSGQKGREESEEPFPVMLYDRDFDMQPLFREPPRPENVEMCFEKWQRLDKVARARLIVRLFHNWPEMLFAWRRRMIVEEEAKANVSSAIPDSESAGGEADSSNPPVPLVRRKRPRSDASPETVRDSEESDEGM